MAELANARERQDVKDVTEEEEVFSVDRNMNEMLLIYEEMQRKYFPGNYAPGS